MSSLLLHWIQPHRLGWLSSHLQQMTKGETYFIMPPLNYRYDSESLDSCFLLFHTVMVFFHFLFLLGR